MRFFQTSDLKLGISENPEADSRKRKICRSDKMQTKEISNQIRNLVHPLVQIKNLVLTVLFFRNVLIFGALLTLGLDVTTELQLILCPRRPDLCTLC